MPGTARIVGTSGHVIQSVPFAIFTASTIRESSFEEVLSEIIRSGGDTDTNGDSTVKRILIIPTKNLSYHGDFTHEVEIMRRGTLKNLRHSVKSFFKEFSKYEIQSLTDDKIQVFLNTHKLNIESLKTLYSEKYYKKTN